MDCYLDTTREGPMFLRRPEVAQLVFVVMGNHVHVLIRPLRQASRVLQWLKGTTAREANLLLARTGEPFWQQNNPVKAGLAAEVSSYRWSSAWKGDGDIPFTSHGRALPGRQ